MDYEKKYKEALENARQEYNTTENVERKHWLEELFPELAESEDEKIRKVLIELVKCNERSGYKLLNNVPTSSMLAWLEKQGELIKKVKPILELIIDNVRQVVTDSLIGLESRLLTNLDNKINEINLKLNTWSIPPFEPNKVWYDTNKTNGVEKGIYPTCNQFTSKNPTPGSLIAAGNSYTCVKETPYKHFTIGKTYKSELDDCLVDDRGEDSLIGIYSDCFKRA